MVFSVLIKKEQSSLLGKGRFTVIHQAGIGNTQTHNKKNSHTSGMHVWQATGKRNRSDSNTGHTTDNPETISYTETEYTRKEMDNSNLGSSLNKLIQGKVLWFLYLMWHWWMLVLLSLFLIHITVAGSDIWKFIIQNQYYPDTKNEWKYNKKKTTHQFPL